MKVHRTSFYKTGHYIMIQSVAVMRKEVVWLIEQLLELDSLLLVFLGFYALR